MTPDERARQLREWLADYFFTEGVAPSPETTPIPEMLNDIMPRISTALSETAGGAFEAAAQTGDRWAEAGGHVGTVGEHIRALMTTEQPTPQCARCLKEKYGIVVPTVDGLGEYLCSQCISEMLAEAHMLMEAAKEKLSAL
jgi:hypothetical protein